MGRSRPTGNELFDILWAEYPPRINGSGVKEKKKKGPALKKFEQENYSDETVYDMIAWIRQDKECRDKSRASKEFYSPPPDLIVFLNQERWMDEIGVEVTDSQRYEKKRSKTIYSKTIQEKINQWSNVIQDWPAGKLKANKMFMEASRAYPEFKAWALEQRPDLRGAKADHIQEMPKKVAIKPMPLAKPEYVRIEPIPVATESPKTTPLDRIKSMVRDVREAKANGTIEKIVQNCQLF